MKLMECLVAQKALVTACGFSSLLRGICFDKDELKLKAVRNTEQCSLHSSLPMLELPFDSFFAESVATYAEKIRKEKCSCIYIL